MRAAPEGASAPLLGGSGPGPDLRHRALVAVGAGAALAAALGAGYALERVKVRRWLPGPDERAAAGLELPVDVVHHHVAVDDGGSIHAVERGAGPALVLVHGLSLGVGIWVRQLEGLGEAHRVIAVAQRGHGQSVAGEDGYSMERLADDLLEVLEALDVSSAVLVGHSLGGMVVELLASRDPETLARRVAGLVLVSTSTGPLPAGPLGPLAVALSRVTAEPQLRYAERRGHGLIAQRDLAAWAARAGFGAGPRPAEVELSRSLTAAMSPSAMAGLLEPLLRFEVRDQLGAIDRPTKVVVGTRDRLTPLRRARLIAGAIADAELVVFEGCGHMVMLERAPELNELLHRFSLECSGCSEGGA